MSDDLPSPWAQACPRAVRLAPDGYLLPVSTLRLHLRRGRPVELLYTGLALEPWLRDGDRFVVDPGGDPRPGDLVLCEAGGWADVRRVLRREGSDRLLTVLDALPRRRASIPYGSLLGIVRGVPGAGGILGALAAHGFPLWSRCAAFLAWRRRILAAPRFGAEAGDSVREKYEQQVPGYVDLLGSPADPHGLGLVRDGVPPGGSVLIAGSGAGGEALLLAREGYRVTGFDFAPAMVEASRAAARAASVEAEFLLADMTALDLGERRFDGAYVTPVVYSFIPGRARRVEGLRRLGRHLATGGPVVFTAYLLSDLVALVESLVAWHRGRRDGVEFGDWHTRYMTPRGTVGASFIHRGFARSVVAEARAAGFARVMRQGPAHFVAAQFVHSG
jgi:SAM-dependent methyltransferase